MSAQVTGPRFPKVVVDLDGSQWEILNRVVLAMKDARVHPGHRDLFIAEVMQEHADRDAFIETCRRWVSEA